MSQIRTNSIVPAGGVPAGADGGGIIQVVSTSSSTTFSTTSTSFVDVTGLSVTITPRSSSNKILVIASVNYTGSSQSYNTFLQLVRGSTAIGNGADGFNGGRSIPDTMVLKPSVGHLDSPSTTSSTTYKIQVRTDGATAYVNRRADGAMTYSSNITVMEVSG